jgi:hypothetical protein
MQTNADLQAEVTALRTQLADGSARLSKMNAELADTNARMFKMNTDSKSLPKKVCEHPVEVVVIQAQATDADVVVDAAVADTAVGAAVADTTVGAVIAGTVVDAAIAYKPPIITYGPWRPDGTRSFVGRHHNGSRFKSDGYPPRMRPRRQSGAL